MSKAAQAAISSDDIDMSVPTASAVPSKETQETEETQEVTFAQLKDYLPHLNLEDLLDTLDAVNTLIRKRIRGKGKAKLSVAAPGPKKPAPPTLARNQAWIRFVQEYVTNNGWEPFEINQTTNGVKELIERSGSIPNDNSPPYFYKDTKTGQTITPAFIFEDTGKHLIYKEAMSLGALLKWKDGKEPSAKENKEDHWTDLYRQFLETYQEQEEPTSSTSSTPDSTTSVRRLTAAERERERLEKQRLKDEAKEEKKRAREEAKEERKREKEAEKERKAAEKEKKAAEKVKKAPSPPALPALPAIPAKAPAKASKAAPAPPALPAPPAPAPVAAAKAAPAKKTILAKPTQPKKEVMTWNIPDDGMIHPWTFQGKRYVVNAQYCCWEATDEDEAGDWVGLVIPEENRIDDSIDEPEYDDEDMEDA
jgi:hypothetical protein